MTTKKNFVFAFISLFAMLLTALGISFAFPSQKADSAIDWTGHSYTKFTPYSTTDGVYLSPIEDNARLGFVVVLVGGYSLIGGSYNGFMTTSAGATCGIDGTTYKGAQHQGTNTNYYDIRYRIEAYAQSNVYIRQARVAAKNASGFYALYTDTDYGINSTTTSFKYGQTIDRDDTFGTVEGSGAYDINMLYDLVLVYEYFINGNSVRVSAGSVADELAGGLGAATTVNPADYEREGYALEGFWTGENKTGTQVLDADGYFVNDYAYTPGATLYPGYTQEIYWTDESVWSAAGKNFNTYSLEGSGTEEDPYLIQSEWDLSFLSWTIYNADEYGVTSSDLYYYDGKHFLQTKDLNFEGYYWQPIGILYTRDGASADRYFSGNYDGDGYTVSGVYTPAGTDNGYSYQGLFGYVYGQSSAQLAIIQNVGVIDSFIQGSECIGGVVGYAVNLTLNDCYNAGLVDGVLNIGGLVGYIENSVLENLYNKANLNLSVNSLKGNAGGLIGQAVNSSIQNCYNSGSIYCCYSSQLPGDYIVRTNIGGLVGLLYEGNSVSECFNKGEITSSYNSVGGIIGKIQHDSNNKTTLVLNCYNTGRVKFYSDHNNATYVYAYYYAGVIGSIGGPSKSFVNIKNCYNKAEINTEFEGITVHYTAGLIGNTISLNCPNVSIENCFNSGNIIANLTAAGLINSLGGSCTVDRCYNTGNVSASWELAGLVADFRGKSITNCYNSGDITFYGDSGQFYIGGVVGYLSSDIFNCYNTGTISVPNEVNNVNGSNVGGVVAYNISGSTVKNCINVGAINVHSSVSNAGEVGGICNYISHIESNYYGGDCEASIGGINGADVDGQAEYLADLDVLAKLEEWYSADSVFEDGSLVWDEEYHWDFESVWAIYGETVNEGYPVFIRYWTDIYHTYENYVFSGAGSQSDPYLIETPQQLAYLSWTIYSGSAHNGQSITINSENYFYQNSYFKQMANLDMSAGYWQPIGVFSTREGQEVNNFFAGHYDGNGYIITGINIPEDTEYSYQGLFGVVKGNITDASVTNVAIYNSNIHGLEYVGGIAGYVGANASVTNSFYQGGVYGSSSGGIVGQVEGGEVSSSGFEGDVSAGVSAIAGVISNGGLVDSSYGIAEAPAQSGIAMYGQIDGGTIQNSLSICHDGDVTSKNYIGSDFSEFVWLNTDSSPIPRSLTWIGSIWPGSVTVDMLSSSGWTEIVA